MSAMRVLQHPDEQRPGADVAPEAFARATRAQDPRGALAHEPAVVASPEHIGLGRQRVRRVLALADHVLYDLSTALTKQY